MSTRKIIIVFAAFVAFSAPALSSVSAWSAVEPDQGLSVVQLLVSTNQSNMDVYKMAQNNKSSNSTTADTAGTKAWGGSDHYTKKDKVTPRSYIQPYKPKTKPKGKQKKTSGTRGKKKPRAAGDPSP